MRLVFLLGACFLFGLASCVGAIATGAAPSAPEATANPWPVSRPTDMPGEPVLEEPTLHCLGVYWIIKGDDQKKDRVVVSYRQAGQEAWKPALPLFRVQHGATSQKTHEAQLNPPDSAWLFAGSILGLAPDTQYEIKLSLVKADGSLTAKTLKARTAAEPTEPPGMRVRHVAPGKGEGDGSKEKPFLGLETAQAAAEPGDLFLVHAGTYGPLRVTRSGAPGKPVIWRGAGDGDAIVDGAGQAKRGIETAAVHDVWFEKLSIKNAYMGIMLIDSSNVVIRRCHLYDVKCGIYNHPSDPKKPCRCLFVADNVLDGPLVWGKDNEGAKVEEYRGIQLTGVGHVVCYNRIRNFKDGMDAFPSLYCSAIDFHNNEVSECMDDGCEMDFSERNTRCFNNRFTNVFQGISQQPVFGGPTYIFRNVLFNVMVEPFKLHHNGSPKDKIDWAPSGAIIVHNTVVKKDEASCLYTGAPVYNCVYRNNLFIGGPKRAMNFDAPMIDCDFDYDGFGGGPWDIFMKWNRVFYKTIDDVRARSPVERHAAAVDAANVFASGIERPADVNRQFDPAKIDLRLKEGSAAVDAGEVLPTVNDGFIGKAPDLGAYELGSPLPHYGPRPER
jgi:hypothetical protein